MKTAMQELIDEIVEQLTYDDNLSDDSRITYETIRLRCLGKLEKEEEQIIEAFEVGYKSCDIDEAFEINRKLASGELYYNQTYNK